MSTELEFGFKRLSPQNWLEPEDLSFLVSINPISGAAKSISRHDWAVRFLKPTLDPSIPRDVRALFEVARGAMLYGCFFYPLYTLAAEQVYRVHEAALAERCSQLGLTSVANFAGRVECLRNLGAISAMRFAQWDAVRNLRNFASHPSKQAILIPTQALMTLDIAVELIHDLFQVPPNG